MKLKTEAYLQQQKRLPTEGRVIIAQYDTDSIIVYQAYRPSIGNFAAQNGYFGGDFKLSRMSWIKPSFLWMMYRSGWGTKEGQEVVLAIRIKRSAFDFILSQAVFSKYIPELYESEKEWNRDLKNSSVRLQWDPDRLPTGERMHRRAIQLGLRGEVLAKYSQEWILEIRDISEFVQQQRQHMMSRNYEMLLLPYEEVYLVEDSEIRERLKLSDCNSPT